MKKIIALTKTELRKQFKKTSIKIILILVLISAFVAPVAMKIINEKFSATNYSQGYQYNLNNIELSLQDTSNSNKEKDKIRKAVLTAEKEMYENLIKDNISYDSWLYRINNNLLVNKQKTIGLQALLDGNDRTSIEENIYGEAIMEIQPYFEQSKEEIQKALEESKKSQQNLVELIVNKDYFKYVSETIAMYEKSIKGTKESISLLQKEINNIKDKNDTKELEILQGRLQDFKIALGKSEELLKVNKYRYDNKISYDGNWKSETLKDIENLVQARQEKELTEDEFKVQNSWEIAQGRTYEQYKENFKDSLQKVNQSIEIDWYSINNDIPQMNFNKDARGAVDGVYSIYISIAVIIGIIIGGGIVSSEFSKGTIRLLMIRPVSRWKILLSKLITVVLICYGVLITSIISVTLSSGVLYGFDTFGYKVLSYSNSAILQSSFISILIGKVLFASISVIFVITFAFAISTLVKNTALAVALPIVAYMAAMPATIVMLGLKMSWIVKTFIPYINLTNYQSGSFYVEMIKGQYGVTVDPNLGAVQLIILSIIFLLISFVVFTKRDISN